MKPLISMFMVVAAMMVCSCMAFAQETFTIGVAPHTSARVILEMYQPLRLHLEKKLAMPVQVVTAPDFTEFARRGLRQEYDLAITTSHQARLLQTDAGYRPLLTYKADFKAVMLVAASGPIRTAKDLKGKKVLGLSPTSQVTLWGEHWLKANRILSLPVSYVSASDSVAQLVIAGEAAASFTSLANFQKLAPDVRKQLRILAESKIMPGRVYALNGRRAAQRKKLEAALWNFAAAPEGKGFFEANSLGGYRKLKPGELASMEDFADEVRRVLRTGEQ